VWSCASGGGGTIAGAGIPPNDCGDVGDTYQVGNMYTDTSTTTTYLCEAQDQWVPINGGRGGVLFIDDFIGGGLGPNTLGENGWAITSIGGGVALASGASTTNHPGVVNLQEGTDNDGEVISLARGSISATDLSARDWGFTANIQSLSAVTSVGMWIGLSTNATSPLTTTGAIHAAFNTDLVHATWQCSMCDSSTTGCQSAGDDVNQKTTASTQTPNASNYDMISIWHRNNGVGGISTYYCSVNGETPRTWCASGCDETASELPAATLFPIIAMQDQVTGTRNFNIDWARFWMTGLAR
jgi:hypothetical protein